MASTPEELWGARSADAKAFADMLASKEKASRRPKSNTRLEQPPLDSGANSVPSQMSRIENSDLDRFEDDSKEKWYETPVAKGIVDAISATVYTTAAINDANVIAARKAREGAESGEIKSLGGAAGVFAGELTDQWVNHNPLVLGVKAGLGDDDSRKTWSDVVANAQESVGLDSTTETNVKWQGGLGLAGDIIMDPLWAVGGGGITAGIKGAVRGSKGAARAAKEVKNGGEALGRETSRVKGAMEGAKLERAQLKASKAEKSQRNYQLNQLNAGIRAGVAPDVLQSTVVRGFDSLPEAVKSGQRKATKNEFKEAIEFEDVMADITARIPSAAPAVGAVESMDNAWAKSVDNSAEADLGMSKTESLVKDFKDAEAELAVAGQEGMAKFRKTRADLNTIAKANGIDLAKAIKLSDSAPEDGLLAGAKVPDAGPATGAPAAQNPVQSLPAAHNFVDSPNSIDVANHLQDTPIDRFVKGTADVTAQVPFYSAARNSKVIEAITSNPNVAKNILEDAQISMDSVAKFLRSKQGVKAGKLTAINRINPKTGKPFTARAKGSVPQARMDLLNEFTKRVYPTMKKNFLDKGDELGANRFAYEWLSKNLDPTDLSELLKTSRAVMKPEVAERFWNGPKPDMIEFRKEAFAGEKIQPSLGQVQEILNSVGTKLPSKESGSFKAIISQYEKGTMPLINRGKLESFAREFFKLGDEADSKEIAAAFKTFLAENSDDIQRVGREYAPMAMDGRLALLPGGQTSDTIRLLESLPEGAMEKYARPLRPQEADSVMTEMARISEAEIINGIAPELVADSVDKIFRQHVLKYSTPIKDDSGTVFRTREGWSTSTEKLTDGGARKEYLWTTHAAIDQIGLIRKEVSAIMAQSPELAALKNARQNAKMKTGVGSPRYKATETQYKKAYQAMYDEIAMRIWGGVDVSMKQGGIFGYLTNVMPKGEIAVRLSGYDVMSALTPELRMKHLWAEKGSIASMQVTQLGNVMETLIRSMAGAGSDGIISETQVLMNAKEILRGNFSKIADKTGIERVIQSNLDAADIGFNSRVMDNAIQAGKFKGTSNLAPTAQALKARERVYNDLLQDIMFIKGADGMTPLQRGIDIMLRNTSLDNAQLSNKIITISDEHLARLRFSLENDSFGKVFDIVTAVVKPEGGISSAAATEVLEQTIKNINNSTFSPREMAGLNAQSKLVDLLGGKPDVIKLNAINAGKVEFGTKIRVPQQKINEANAAVAKATQNPAIAPETVIETAMKVDDEVLVDMFRQQEAFDIATRYSLGEKLFNTRMGMHKSYDQVTMGMHGTTQIETAFHSALNEFARKFSPEQAAIALKSLQSMGDDGIAAVLAKEIEVDPQTYGMARIVSNIFDESKSNIFVRNGIGPETMNRILDNMTNVPPAWRFDPELEPAEMAKAWKEWTDISNPYKALSAIHTAMMKATTDISAGARFSSNFGIAKVPVGEQGQWVKLGNVDKARSNSEFVNLIDTNLYYPKEIVAEIPAISNFITGSRSFKNEQWAQWVSSYDELTSALKMTQTVMKPGHHVMSIIGDFFRNSLAGLNGTTPYKDSWKVIRAMNQADAGLSEMDKFSRLKTAMSNDSISNSATGVRIKNGNQQFTISYNDLYTQFANRGIFLPPHNGGVVEDLLSVPGQSFEGLNGSPLANTVSKVAQGTNAAVSALVNNRLIKMNTFTSQRDNLFRGALAIDVIKKGNFKSIEEAIDAAELHVRKWAPVAKDLTNLESKYVRRVFLYYTWLRGIIPRVAESLIQKPALSTAPSKAMYGIAEMNGLDPASFGDPFDPDAMFPSYYKEGVLGPQWEDPESGHLWGLNPTSPIIDVLNSVGSGVSLAGFIPGGDEPSNYNRIFKTLAGMTNPLLRSPIEFGAGVNAGTGAPIQDKFQYALDMPGPIRLASKISGKTFNPTMGGIVNRTEKKFADGLEGEDFWNNAKLETINWLTGMQVKDYTSDSAENTAKYEELNKEKTQAKIDQRRGE